MPVFREIAGSFHPPDIADEGVEACLDNMQRLCGVTAVYLVALMARSKRPHNTDAFPHNPRRKVFYPEEGHSYWLPNAAAYAESRIKVHPAAHADFAGVDWLDRLIKAARRRDLGTGVELSHDWIDGREALAHFPDCLQQDVFGHRLERQMCVNHPDVLAYAQALYADLVHNHDVDLIQTCVRLFNPGRALTGGLPGAAGGAGPAGSATARLMGTVLGGCFCDHCGAAAHAQGIDWERIVRRLRAIAGQLTGETLEGAHAMSLWLRSDATPVAALLEVPELAQWLALRRDGVTRFYERLYARVKSTRPGVDVRLNHYSREPELLGLSLAGVAPHLDSVRSSDYSEESGDPARLAHKRAYCLGIRRAIGWDKTFNSAIGVRAGATPELIRQGVVISAQCGADGLSIGHYDGGTFRCLEAIKEGLTEADATVEPASAGTPS